jgi:3'-phosphoadenosine 5'-phosphosulfate sulfotransferase (PAPS reductase)/FAD synthetase
MSHLELLANVSHIRALIARGAHFYVGHSGGKDSQAMYILLKLLVPAAQLHVVHADLGIVEHRGTLSHIRATIGDDELLIAQAIHADGSIKDFFSAVRARRVFLDTPSAKYPNARRDTPAYPSKPNRFCTSDLKRDPIWKVIRNDGDHRIVVNCIGIRGAESPDRQKKIDDVGTFTVNKPNTNGKRDAYDWSPIAHFNCISDKGFNASTMVDHIFGTIIEAGQQPHPAYGFDGVRCTLNERLSCCFCIFGSLNDLRIAYRDYPELFAMYEQLERDTRTTMFHTQTLREKLNLINLVEVA